MTVSERSGTAVGGWLTESGRRVVEAVDLRSTGDEPRPGMPPGGEERNVEVEIAVAPWSSRQGATSPLGTWKG